MARTEPGVASAPFGYAARMARRKHPEDEGIPPSNDPSPDRPSDDDELQPPLPGDRPYGANDLVTALEQRRGETFRTRAARERPDATLDDEASEEAAEPIGRIHEPTEGGRDVVGELVAEETEDDAGLAAEEAAISVHEADERMPDEPSTDEAEGKGPDRGA